MWGRRDGIRGRGPEEPQGQQPLTTNAVAPARHEATMPAALERGQTSSWTPCHHRRVRIEGDVSGSNVVVRCPLCSQLWEVRFAPYADDGLFALWVP